MQQDGITVKTREALFEVGQATTELIQKVIRNRMETKRTNTTEETYKYDKYIMLDVSWGQFVEGDRDKTKPIVRGRDARSGFQRTIQSNDKVIVITSCTSCTSFTALHCNTVMNTRERK